jgi:hypothetical protein
VFSLRPLLRETAKEVAGANWPVLSFEANLSKVFGLSGSMAMGRFRAAFAP